MSYNKYPKEMKETIIARMLEGDETVTDIQRDTGVGINTLYRWRDQAKHQKGDYYGAAEPPVRCGVSHLSGLTEPLH